MGEGSLPLPINGLPGVPPPVLGLLQRGETVQPSRDSPLRERSGGEAEAGEECEGQVTDRATAETIRDQDSSEGTEGAIVLISQFYFVINQN